jgi:hypothetical protein
LQHYQAAIDIFSLKLKGKDRATADNKPDEDTELRKNIVRALVGQVEIWMDPSYDLWFGDIAHSSSMYSCIAIIASNRMQRRSVKIYLLLLCKPIPETLRGCKRWRQYECHNNGLTTPNNV